MEDEDVRGAVDRLFYGGEKHDTTPVMTPYTLQPDLPMRTFTVLTFTQKEEVIRAHGHSVGQAGDLQFMVQRGRNTCVVRTFAPGRWADVSSSPYTREELEAYTRELEAFESSRAALLENIQRAEEQAHRQQLDDARKMQTSGAVTSGRNLLRKH